MKIEINSVSNNQKIYIFMNLIIIYHQHLILIIIQFLYYFLNFFINLLFILKNNYIKKYFISLLL